VAKVVREGNSVRHHHVASIGKVKHSGRHPDGRYKFALGSREMLWQWVEDLCAREHFDDATAVEFRDAVAKKIQPPTANKRQSTLPSQPGSAACERSRWRRSSAYRRSPRAWRRQRHVNCSETAL
jgi:hypothetical protein